MKTYSLTLDQIISLVGDNKISCERIQRRPENDNGLPYYNLKGGNDDCIVFIGWEKNAGNYSGWLSLKAHLGIKAGYKLDNDTTTLAYNYMMNILHNNREKEEQELEQVKETRLKALLNKYCK